MFDDDFGGKALGEIVWLVTADARYTERLFCSEEKAAEFQKQVQALADTHGFLEHTVPAYIVRKLTVE